MNLKIESGGEERIFVFQDKTKISVGSSPSCDISLQEDGVESVHLQIHEKNGEYFVEDMGTKGATFINSKSLETNKLEPFNSFFPIKLGQDVFVYLLDEVPSINSELSEDTSIKINPEALEALEQPKKKTKEELKNERVYVPKSHGKVNPEKMPREIKIQRKKIVLGKKAKKKSKKKAASNIFYGLLFICVLGFANKDRILGLVASEKKVVEAPKSKPVVTPKPKVKKDSFNEKKAIAVAKLDKCLSKVEAELCKPFTSTRELRYPEGFVQILSNLYLVVDIDEANTWKRYELNPNEEELGALTRLGQLRMGAAFDLVNFKSNDFLVEDVDIFSPVALKAAMVTELFQYDLWERIGQLKDIEQLYVILVDSTGAELRYLGHLKTASKGLGESIDAGQLKKELLYYWRTGIKYDDSLLENANIILKSF